MIFNTLQLIGLRNSRAECSMQASCAEYIHLALHAQADAAPHRVSHPPTYTCTHGGRLYIKVVCRWKLGLQLERYGMTSINENRHLITAYPCFEADNDSAEPANLNTKIDSKTALILFISQLYTHSPRSTRQWRGG